MGMFAQFVLWVLKHFIAAKFLFLSLKHQAVALCCSGWLERSTCTALAWNTLQQPPHRPSSTSCLWWPSSWPSCSGHKELNPIQEPVFNRLPSVSCAVSDFQYQLPSSTNRQLGNWTFFFLFFARQDGDPEAQERPWHSQGLWDPPLRRRRHRAGAVRGARAQVHEPPPAPETPHERRRRACALQGAVGVGDLPHDNVRCDMVFLDSEAGTD